MKYSGYILKIDTTQSHHAGIKRLKLDFDGASALQQNCEAETIDGHKVTGYLLDRKEGALVGFESGVLDVFSVHFHLQVFRHVYLEFL